MENFDLRKYLAEGRLLKENIDEGRMKDPSGSIKMGKYPQVSSDTPVPMNVKYLTTNGEKLTMKVQAKNRKEAVDAVKSKDSNFKAEIKTDFVYDKDGNKLVKEEFVKGTPQYYVKYTTQDGEEVKSELMSKREAIYKERDLVDSGVNKSSVHKIQKNMDLNGKEYEIEYELDKDIEYRTDEEGKPIMENIQDEDLLASQAIDILDEFRVYAESEDLIQYLNKSMDYLERIPSNDDVYSAIQAVADGLNLYTGEEFDYEVDEMQSELERLIA
jgi:hypothetical protein